MNFSLRLKHSEAHSELTTQLIQTFLQLRQSSQSIATESLHYYEINEAANGSLLKTLQMSADLLRVGAEISPTRIHMLIFKGTNIVAMYSG